MRGLRFNDGEGVTVQVTRGSVAVDSATGQDSVTYPTVSGLGTLLAAVQHLSSQQASAVLGRLTGESWMFAIDAEQVPAGAFIAEGDRLSRSDNGETFTVVQARLLGPGRGITWEIMAQRKTA